MAGIWPAGGTRSMSRKGTGQETRVHWQLRNLDDRQADSQYQGSGFWHCRGKALPVGRNKKKDQFLARTRSLGQFLARTRQGLVGGIVWLWSQGSGTKSLGKLLALSIPWFGHL